uniref:Large ribosomal subunit protein uL30 n=1 Tax=uncultured Chloroflexi bacterium Rifle_16ft_4_minimus_5165 TaxID=1665076 RepID=A0A0H4T959_9CHLR|nr:50S ribosomal protein L30, large subunit ribosomal protein L30 [uncultured Chloroflexi bacterium Rifle_16ft_4_minimus_5165]
MAAKKDSGKQLILTLVRSPIGYEESQKKTVRSLGLGRMHASVVREDSPALRGMINKVSHLLKVEEA